MTAAVETLNLIIAAHLRNASPVWGERVRSVSTVEASLVRPYVHFFIASELNEKILVRKRHTRIALSVKGVAENLGEALQMQGLLADLLDDSGQNDINARLPAHPDWAVLSVTQGRAIILDDFFKNAVMIYHRGHQFEILMEEK